MTMHSFTFANGCTESQLAVLELLEKSVIISPTICRQTIWFSYCIPTIVHAICHAINRKTTCALVVWADLTFELWTQLVTIEWNHVDALAQNLLNLSSFMRTLDFCLVADLPAKNFWYAFVAPVAAIGMRQCLCTLYSTLLIAPHNQCGSSRAFYLHIVTFGVHSTHFFCSLGQATQTRDVSM